MQYDQKEHELWLGNSVNSYSRVDKDYILDNF